MVFLLNIFINFNKQITVQSNIKVVNCLDITLNLSNGKFYLYRKSNDKPLYINTRSNHLPSIIKQLPSGINKYISSLSCNAEEFEKAIPAYNDPLQKSGFTQRLAFNDKINTDTEKSKKSFENPNYRSSTTLSKYIWDLKEEETNYEIKWSIVKRVRAYKSRDAQCHLCLQEKLCILNAEKKTLLNKRSELLAKCRHRNKFYAANYKPP